MSTDVHSLVDSPVIPVFAPKKYLNTILLQLSDHDLKLEDDSGVVGRLKVSADHANINFDIKGSVYSGEFFSTCSTLLLTVNNDCARIEGICNDVVELLHEGDIHDHENVIGEIDESMFDFSDEDANAEWREEQSDKRKKKKSRQRDDEDEEQQTQRSKRKKPTPNSKRSASKTQHRAGQKYNKSNNSSKKLNSTRVRNKN